MQQLHALDLAVLHEFVGTNPVLVKELLEMFRDSAADTSRALCDAVSQGDSSASMAAAHKLKSSARMIGALPLGELCEALETAGRAHDVDALTKLLPQFTAEMSQVERALPAAIAAQQPQAARSA